MLKNSVEIIWKMAEKSENSHFKTTEIRPEKTISKRKFRQYYLERI